MAKIKEKKVDKKVDEKVDKNLGKNEIGEPFVNEPIDTIPPR